MLRDAHTHVLDGSKINAMVPRQWRLTSMGQPVQGSGRCLTTSEPITNCSDDNLKIHIPIPNEKNNEHFFSSQYENSAHVVSVWARGSWSFATQHGLHNFLGIHKAYVHPDYVLENEHVTLHGADKTHVWFCVSHPGQIHHKKK